MFQFHLDAISPPTPFLDAAISPIATTQTTTPLTETPTLNAISMNDLGEAVLYVDDQHVGEASPDEEIETLQMGFRDEMETETDGDEESTQDDTVYEW